MINTNQIDITLKRFTTLYPKLAKKEQFQITMQEKIKLCRFLAKGEAVTLRTVIPDNIYAF